MQQSSLYVADDEQSSQRDRVHDTWEGSAVIERRGTTAELYRNIPTFTRHPYRSGGEENRYKDEIRRQPLELSETEIPIATVSKTYSLAQHRDVISSVFRALQLMRRDISKVEATLLLSEYGERMHWSCQIPGFDFDPGDQNPIVLRMNCLNSVDRSTVLEIALSWFRLVCSNGLMFGVGDSRLRKRHVYSLDPEDIASYLEGELEHVMGEQSVYQSWLEKRVESKDLESWVDSDVAGSWGPHAACRIWHIVTQGVDGAVERGNEKKLPAHVLPFSDPVPVPGAAVQAITYFSSAKP